MNTLAFKIHILAMTFLSEPDLLNIDGNPFNEAELLLHLTLPEPLPLEEQHLSEFIEEQPIESPTPRQKRRISPELKRLIVRNCQDEDMPISECARVLGLDRSTVIKLLKSYRDRGTIEGPRCGGKDQKLTDLEKEQICDLLDDDCSRSLADLVEYCQREFGKTVSTSTISRVLKDFH